MSVFRLLLAWMVLACQMPLVSATPIYDSVVVYGDSLSDNGNLFSASGFPPAPYFDGRRSNGPVAVEYLAQTLHAPLIDFAWIGATTGIGNYADGGSTTTLGLANLPGMTTVFGATSSLLSPYLANGLFVVWGGPNDLLAPSPLDTTAEAILNRAVANVLAIVSNLQTMGANSILVPGMLDLGLTPFFKSLGANAAAGATTFSDLYNAALFAALPSGVLRTDTAALMRDVVSNPAAYGLSNATDPCFDQVTVCADPSQYVFFDDFHPTTAGHQLLAQSLYGTVAMIPEPSSVWLLLAGFCLLAWTRGIKQTDWQRVYTLSPRLDIERHAAPKL